jgi:hypothetical protein
MPLILRNIFAVIAGVVVGSVVNMAIITVGPELIPVPDGVDLSEMEHFAENLKLLKPANFIAPWLAHALGAMVGAFIAAKVAASHKMIFALGISVFFLLGGINVWRPGMVYRTGPDRSLLADGIPWRTAGWSAETATGLTSDLAVSTRS